MKNIILHCNETYAEVVENYVFDQVQNNDSFEGLLFSDKFINSKYGPINKSKSIFLRNFLVLLLLKKVIVKTL